ncbi:EscF/YscF/HrpA family type III secretion system needle major subunit [Providencia stuartii]|uniref:EscF/YscF/HrpA family type III secretion system needle major subunit n=1 Tax=Providencia stuartii TaxID=588 RepID=A0AAJ1JI66_PROST|nr:MULTISPECIES: EscF/YscF/HrpA family type III secretion system needle major subunit [Providencia]EMA3640175.1 type III secretion apparatus needle protein [Providencia stuartii]MBW3101677.1 EscF/YscF/HrpA family type III secretion system needle major subunit [Providencia stuartii]MCB5216104.1 EscF/YscF/HrpA family type III secretion system needle major subunit [Providencia stuartii]MDE5308139.1 EscF/YscF/HrpA family type III secretion system needle major subunit [Providencia stuartii]MDE87505
MADGTVAPTIPGINKDTGNWESSAFETPVAGDKNWGMMYRSSANVSNRAKELADELKDILDGKTTKLEVDNPLVLGKITALSGNYNMARQLQSNLMKSIKDTAQAIIRNV